MGYLICSSRLKSTLATQRQRSFERRRPHVTPPPAPAPQPRPTQRPRGDSYGGRRYPRPLSPQSPGYDQEYGFFPPAPEVPLSPSTTNTTSTRSSTATSSSMHWVPRLFDQNGSTTAFRKIGQRYASHEYTNQNSSDVSQFSLL